jgi:hypothetical protein
LTDDDLLLLDQQKLFREVDNGAEERDNVEVKEFTLNEFEDIFRAVAVVKQILWLLTLTRSKHANSPRCGYSTLSLSAYV